jgi:hypothetical protein
MISLGIHIDLGQPESDEWVADATANLVAEVWETPIDEVHLIDDNSPPDTAKGFGLVALGSFVVRFATGEALGHLADVLVAWLGRDKGRSLTLTDGDRSLELTGLSAKNQRAIAIEWMEQSLHDQDRRG